MNNHKAGHQTGQALLEQALTLMVFILVFLGTLDIGRGVYIQNTVTYAARKGARYAITNPTDTPGIEATVRNHLIGLDPDQATTAVTRDPNDRWVEVTVTYPYTAITPLVSNFIGNGGTISFVGSSRMRR